MPTTEDIRQSLLERNAEFRRLVEEHFRCAVQLEQIHDDPYVNADDLLQESVLKKLKLRLKDQMEMMVAQYHQGSLQH